MSSCTSNIRWLIKYITTKSCCKFNIVFVTLNSICTLFEKQEYM